MLGRRHPRCYTPRPMAMTSTIQRRQRWCARIVRLRTETSVPEHRFGDFEIIQGVPLVTVPSRSLSCSPHTIGCSRFCSSWSMVFRKIAEISSRTSPECLTCFSGSRILQDTRTPDLSMPSSYVKQVQNELNKVLMSSVW